MKKINVIWANRNLLKQDSSFSYSLKQLREYMVQAHYYKHCTDETIIGRMLLKSLFPQWDWDMLLTEIEYSAEGKPFLSNGVIRFSISHADDMIVLAWSGKVNVGVDVVRVDRENEYAHLFLHEEEILIKKTGMESLFFLNSMWARKEAMSKLTGEGWGMGYSKINSLQPVHYQGRQIHFSEIRLTDEYYCVVSTDEEALLTGVGQLDADQLMITNNILIS